MNDSGRHRLAPGMSHDKAALLRLYALRVQRLQQKLNGARVTLALLDKARVKQQSVVDELLDALAQSTDPAREKSPGPTPVTLSDRANWQHWLHYDLEKERYYLDVALQDCEVALKVSKTARADWLRGRARLDRLQERFEDQSRKATARASLREDRREDRVVAPVGAATPLHKVTQAS